MTTPLLKPVRRLVKIRGIDYVVEFTGPAIQFRVPRSRRYLLAPMYMVLQMAERLAGEEAYQEKLRTKALARIARSRNGR